MKILAVSTSTPRGSAAVFDDERAVFAVSYVDLQGHAERLFHAIDAVLAEAGLDRRAIEALACDIGPGSFTGVRVGVASAKGIALALCLPLVGVPSLEAMAAAAFGCGVAGDDDVVLAAIDAKKAELFVATYGARHGRLVERVPPGQRPFDVSGVGFDGAASRVVVVGEIAASLDPPPPGLSRGPELDLPSAVWVARIARARLASGDRGDPAAVEPLYVRPPDAKPMTPLPA